MRILNTFLTCVILVLGILSDATAAPLHVGDVTPTDALSTLSGEEFHTSNLRGRYVYVDFWASWCPPCRLSLPFMNRLHDEFSQQNFTILAVSIDDDDRAAKQIINSVHPKYQVVRDVDKKFISAFDPPKMPSSYLIDPEGKIVFVHEGFSGGEETLISAKIRAAVTRTQN